MRSALAGNFRKLLHPGLRGARVFCVPKPSVLAPVAVTSSKQ
nr:MAG TPA: xcyI restriction endonuclease [Caudoviricetes sp.]